MTAPTAVTDNRNIPSWRVRLSNRDIQRAIVNLSLIIVLAVVIQLGTNALFFTSRNLSAVTIQIAVVTILACAMTLVMIAGAIDISVSGTVVLSGVVAGLLINAGMPMWLAFVLASLTGGVVGLINSFLVLGLGISALIATIGTLYMCQGVANLLTNGLPIAGMPLSFGFVGSGRIHGIPFAVPMIIVVVAIFVGIQRFTTFGRYTIATGSNQQAAFLNGVNVRKTLILCFVFTGIAAGWGGIVYASRIGNPTPVLDNDLLFQVIVAIVVGGTSLFGGEGSVFGTLLGSILIGVVNNGLNLFGVSTFWQYLALGGLLVVSVGSDTVFRREAVYRLRRKLFSRGVADRDTGTTLISATPATPGGAADTEESIEQPSPLTGANVPHT